MRYLDLAARRFTRERSLVRTQPRPSPIGLTICLEPGGGERVASFPERLHPCDLSVAESEDRAARLGNLKPVSTVEVFDAEKQHAVVVDRSNLFRFRAV